MLTKVKDTSLSDEALMEVFTRNREEWAISQLYQRYFSALSKYLGWLANDSAQGKDLAQNIFLKIYQRPETFDVAKNFKIWLFAISKNQWKNNIRDELTRKKHQHLFSTPTEVVTSSQTGEAPEMQMQQRLAQLQTALTTLSESHKEVFILKYSNNLTLQEISEICNCSVGTVKSRLFYALKKLKEKVK